MILEHACRVEHFCKHLHWKLPCPFCVMLYEFLDPIYILGKLVGSGHCNKLEI